MEKAREIQRRRDNSSSNVRKICNLHVSFKLLFFATTINVVSRVNVVVK